VRDLRILSIVLMTSSMSSVDLNGHEVGNGGYGQGRSTARRVLLYSERFPITAALIGVSLIFDVLSVAILAVEATARGKYKRPTLRRKCSRHSDSQNGTQQPDSERSGNEQQAKQPDQRQVTPGLRQLRSRSGGGCFRSCRSWRSGWLSCGDKDRNIRGWRLRGSWHSPRNMLVLRHHGFRNLDDLGGGDNLSLFYVLCIDLLAVSPSFFAIRIL
jgi:hypothetical protein